MRIIAGTRKGHRIDAPKGLATRPTSDRVRENVFNIIGPLDDATVLDLFAGSGAMGIEAMSRGATRAVFVDNDRASCRAIQRNLEKLRLTGAIVICQDVRHALAQESAAGRRYDLVLVDPPYDQVPTLTTTLGPYLANVLSEDGVLVFESDARTEPELPLPVRTSRKYGSTRVTVFEQSE